MSVRALVASIAMALVWTGAACWAMRPATPKLRYFVADQGQDTFRVQADEARVEGFCTVFVRDGLRIAAVCGQHTWSEAREAE